MKEEKEDIVSETQSIAKQTNPNSPSPSWEKETMEKLLFASLKEQAKLRRWKYTYRWAFLLIILGAIAWKMLDFNYGTTKKHTALVHLEDEIASNTSANAENVNEALDNAFKDSSAAGIILHINSPGGSPVQAGMIYDHIMSLRKQYPNKPIYAVIEEIGTSAAYYIAAATQKIYVNKASIVGSIGVIGGGNFGFPELLKKLGVERRLITAGKNKAFLDPFSPIVKSQETYEKNMLAEIHRQFINAVQKGRGSRLKNDPDLYTGLVWTGEKSVTLGLTDGLATVNEVAHNLFKAEDIVDYSIQEDITTKVAKRFTTSFEHIAFKLLTQFTLR